MAHLPPPPVTQPPPLPLSQPGSCTAVETLSPSPFWGLCRPGPAWWSILPACKQVWTHCTHTAMALSCPQCVKVERALSMSSQIPSVLNHNGPASLSLSPLCLSSEGKGPSHPHSCAAARVCVDRSVCSYLQYVWGGGEEEWTTPPLKT